MQRKISGFLIFLFGAFALAGAQETVIAGRFVDSVKVTDEDHMAYYVPQGYSADNAWPVIYVYGPVGNTEKAISVFVEAAEKFGYIVVSSSAVKNGSYQENYRHARALFDKTHALFSIDEAMQFTAGFSGGGRLAIAIASLSKEIKGVISIGAGVPGPTISMLEKSPFVFIGISGDEDFNYSEMLTTEKLLTNIRFKNRLILYNGGHDWPPREVVEKAVRDLSVAMVGKGHIKWSEEELEQAWSEEMIYIEDLINNDKMLWAFNNLEKDRDWYGIYDRDKELKERMKAVRKDKRFRTQRADAAYIGELESAYLSEYLNYLPEDIGRGDLEALGYWDQELDDLRKNLLGNKKEVYQKLGVRILNLLSAVGAQVATQLKEPDHYDQLLFYTILKTLIDPKDYDAYLEVMRFTVIRGEYGMGMYYADKLFENGFRDLQKLRSYEGITLLRIQPEFSEILEKYELDPRY